MRVDADRRGDRLQFLVGQHSPAVLGHGVQHLAAQRQHRLRVLVARLLRRAASRVAFDQEQFVPRDIAGSTIDELAGQRGDAGGFLPLDLLALGEPRKRLLDGQLDDLPALLRVLAEPQLEGVAHAHLEQLGGVPRGELLLRLAVELRAHDARREREAGALPQVVRDQLHALGREGARVHERGQGLEDSRAEARLVRAARARRDQVDVAVGEGVAVGDPADRPARSFSRLDLGDIGILEEALPREQGSDQFASLQHEVEVLRHAALVLPGLLLLAFNLENHRQAGEQVGLRAHQVLELRERDVGRVEVFRVRPELYYSAGALLLYFFRTQFILKLAAFERDRVFLSVSEHRDFAALRKRIRNL